jgi:hypothetical protein
MEITDHLHLEEGMPKNSGWAPPSLEDKQQVEDLLKMSRSANPIDIDQLMVLPPRDTHLFDVFTTVMKQINGPDWKYRPQYQHYGTCVGQSSKMAADLLMAFNAIFYQMVFPGRAAVAGMYTFSRVEIGGQPGRWEGSNGYQAAAGMIKYGVLLLKDIGLPEDAREADENLAMKWTASKAGVPDNFQQMAGNILVSDVVVPKSIQMAAKLIQAGSPQFVGTTYIPIGQRNSDGISRCQRGREGHEMCVCGVEWKNGSPWKFLQLNTWDTWGTGPLPGTTPVGSVWISASDYEKQMADGDSSSIVGVNGLKFDM